MAEDLFIQLIERTHADVQASRAARGLPPYPFREIKPMPSFGVLASLETIMADVFCKCGCGEKLSEATISRGWQYVRGHKPAKSLRDAAIRRGSVLNATPAQLKVPTEQKLNFPRMLRFAEVELATAQRELEQATQDAFDAANRAGVAKTKIEKLIVLIQSLQGFVPNESNLSSRTDGGMQRPGSPQLAELGNQSAETEVPYFKPYGEGLSGAERSEPIGDQAHS